MKLPRVNRRVRLFLLIALAVLDAVVLVTGTSAILAVFLSLALLLGGLRSVLRRSRLIWRLRNRLIVTYVFIGVVPILLILALSYFGAWIVVGQVATYLVRSELYRRAASLEEPAKLLSRTPVRIRAAALQQMAPLFRDRAPGAEVLITSENGDPPLRYPPDNTLVPLEGNWKDYTGLVYRNGRFYALAVAHYNGTRALICSPLRPRVLESLVPGIGALNIFQVVEGHTDLTRGLAGSVPPSYTPIDSTFAWFNALDAHRWEKPEKVETGVLSVTTRTSAVLSVIFADQSLLTQFSIIGFVTVSILLAIVELISALIGFSMTRAITGAVHGLYQGTLSIGRGDFSHRIPVRGDDQLADLGHSFNQMTEQLEQLVVVAKEKERMQSELTIASEVQKQLFPRAAPGCRTIELIGACEPARSAAGDYYDYLQLPDGNLALAIGDVAGKGISAALLMASIQSIMRTQLLAGHGGRLSTAALVAQLNRQLYASTSPEKYATFFFGLYDETTREMTYTNAGHLSPLLLRDGTVRELEVTGTVVGLFPASAYEEQRVTLAPGDLLVGFTDGITEPENAYGAEFGTERLADTVLKNRACETHEIVAKVMEAVRQWSNSPELPDDMTVLIARRLS